MYDLMNVERGTQYARRDGMYVYTGCPKKIVPFLFFFFLGSLCVWRMV
jgi:hypothetical protein